MADMSADRNEKGQFVQGVSGNPNGRGQGSRNKLGEQFVDDLYAHWQTHGKAALDGCLEESPAQYCRVVASLLPKQAELKIVNPLEDVSDDDLAIGLAAIRAARAASANGSGVRERTVEASSKEKPDRVH